MVDGQFRYKTNYSNTEIELTHMNKDDVKGKSRHAYSLKDDRVFKNTLIAGKNGEWDGSLITSSINIGGISDLTYFDDFGNSVSRIGRTHITRQFSLDRVDYSKYGYLNTSVKATDYQLVKEELQEQYSVLPQARVEYSSYEKNNELKYTFNGELSVFDHTYSYKATGTRVTLYPSIEYPMRNIGWELTPKIGIKHRSYSLSGNSNNSINDTTPILSLRGKMIFDKIQSNNILQTLEPEMYLLYIPASNQDNIPIFDAGENDLKYNLFSENRFYGEDRLNDAKQITLSLSSSITDTASGNELLRGTIGQIFYLDNRSVNLNNSETQEATSSNIVGLLNARLTDHWRLSLIHI